MLTLTIGEEFFNEETEKFEVVEPMVLELEHSLVSLSKWESRFAKPFLGNKELTEQELEYYVEAMILTPDFPPGVVRQMSLEHIREIQEYIASSRSATTFGDMPKKNVRNEVITSELIYYWMVAFNIPWDAERWHLNRLFMLIQVCNVKNTPPKKMSKHEAAKRNRDENEKRKRELGTKG